MKEQEFDADICVILEGTYPYTPGGVATWTHDLITAQKDLTFHILSVMAPEASLKHKYQLPPNVKGITNIFVQELPSGSLYTSKDDGFLESLEKPLDNYLHKGDIKDLSEILKLIKNYPKNLGGRILLDSKGAWSLLERMYNKGYQNNSFLHYFWTWRMVVGGLLSMLVPKIPHCKAYHAVSTGYAGLLGTRAFLEYDRPLILTEHGIYTNERRIELAMATWIHEKNSKGFTFENSEKGLKDLLIDYFVSFSNSTYQAASEIITLYEENQVLQKEDGADERKLSIIPNGIDWERYSGIERIPHEKPTVAFIGRVVPIKDVKTFLQACAILKNLVPDVEVLIMGPYEEDQDYYDECLTIYNHLGMAKYTTFTGRVNLNDYLGKVDVIVFTSISEAQPLTILEAGASGIPSVTTNVGACKEMIFGRSDEDPPLGQAGDVTPLASPKRTAEAIAKILNSPKLYEQCSNAIKERVFKYYNLKDVNEAYNKIYLKYSS